MLLMIEKPLPTVPERARSALRVVGRRALALAEAALLWPSHVAENRRLIGALAAMSDHDLSDIGLTRGDLRDATALPGAADAGRFFAGRRQSRRTR